MEKILLIRPVALGLTLVALAACGAPTQSSNPGTQTARELDADGEEIRYGVVGEGSTSVWDAFRRSDAEVQVKVNKYLWSASLEVLNFLPVESVDPFTGVIITGFGTPPGGSRAYRATILIDDPALSARSLNVALQTRNAPADAATVRAIEDAILTRARQLRIADNSL
jgi:hypothetical protein